jgi:SET domain-containing protein
MSSTRKSSSTAKSPKSPKAADSSSPSSRRAKVVVRNSRIHGRGVYATRRILSGERVAEYKGQVISWDEADRRPPSDPSDPQHTFFFSLANGEQVIDGNVGGNVSRYINHSCEPNCETEETDDGRIYVVALRDIRRGEEIVYDYCLIIDEPMTSKLRKQYLCLCGSDACRGTMLAGKRKKRRKHKH